MADPSLVSTPSGEPSQASSPQEAGSKRKRTFYSYVDHWDGLAFAEAHPAYYDDGAQRRRVHDPDRLVHDGVDRVRVLCRELTYYA